MHELEQRSIVPYTVGKIAEEFNYKVICGEQSLL